MKEKDFIKKYGWTAVNAAVKSTTPEETAFFESTDLEPILSKNGNFIGFDVKVYRIKYDEVKRLIESYKIVNFYGGIQNAKEIVKISVRSGYGPSSLSDINQAIADV